MTMTYKTSDNGEIPHPIRTPSKLFAAVRILNQLLKILLMMLS